MNFIAKYDFFKHPERIHNMDESHCSFQHKPTRVLANCTFQNTSGRVADSKEGTTFITHACANGTYFPPLVIVKGKIPNSLLGFNTQDGPKGAIWTYQEKAWTEMYLGLSGFSSLTNISNQSQLKMNPTCWLLIHMAHMKLLG